MDRESSLVGVDVPLLAALKELLDTESVTVAARRLGSTQPALSRVLGRLRGLFDDPLLVPVGRGLKRTERARELQPRIDRALAGMRTLLAPAAALVPSEERRVVRIAASDYATAAILHPWIRRLRGEAPGVVVEIEPISAGTIDPLAYGEIDLAIAPKMPVIGLDQFVFRDLHDDRSVCALRKDHPAARGKLTLGRYLALEHAMVSSRLPPVSTVDAALHAQGKVRNVVLRVPTFLSLLRLVEDTDLVGTVPSRLVRAADARLAVRPLPFRVEPISLHLVWHPRRATDPFHRWLREEILVEAKVAAAKVAAAKSASEKRRAPERLSSARRGA